MPLTLAAYRITAREKELLDILVHRVRVLSVPQIVRTWWPTANIKDVTRRLERLHDVGLICLFRALSHPELVLSDPVISWKPGAAEPDFGQASYRLKSRWKQSPLSLKCAIATTQTGRSFGGTGGRFPRESEQTHDLHLAAVFLNYRIAQPECISLWRSEARILWERRGVKNEKLPDAVLDLPTGPKIIEFGGAYPKHKVERFHRYCSLMNTPYEVW